MQRAEHIMRSQAFPAVSRAQSPAVVVSRRATGAAQLLDLQRSHGNAFVGRMIQCRLAVSQPGDPYEQEAERVADAAVKMSVGPAPAATLDRQEQEGSAIQRMCSDCHEEVGRQALPIKEEDKDKLATVRRQEMPKEEEEIPLPRMAVSAASAFGGVTQPGDGTLAVGDEVESGIRGLQGGGRPLAAPVRADMESRMGFDFSSVRVHNDGQANHLTRSVNALAFTHGNDVVFGSGQYQPETPEGKRLLAHELTHVVQQTGGTASSTDAEGDRGSK